jgi:hypothetical protein
MGGLDGLDWLEDSNGGDWVGNSNDWAVDSNDWAADSNDSEEKSGGTHGLIEKFATTLFARVGSSKGATNYDGAERSEKSTRSAVERR